MAKFIIPSDLSFEVQNVHFSPSIADIAYDKKQHILGIIYVNALNKLVLYKDVPNYVWDELKFAEKPGVYVAVNIKPVYESTTVSKSLVYDKDHYGADE